MAGAGELLGPVGGGLLLPASVLLHIPGIIMQTVDTRECPLSSVAINWCQVRDGVLSSAIAREKSTKSKSCKIVCCLCESRGRITRVRPQQFTTSADRNVPGP